MKSLTQFSMENKKLLLPTRFFVSVTSPKVGINPQDFLTIRFNTFATLLQIHKGV